MTYNLNSFTLPMYMTFKTEKEYQSSFIKKLKETNPNMWLYKIPDVNMQIKPFDIICSVNWASIAYELKICDLKKGLTYEQAFRMLRPNQVWALNSHQKSWWLSYVCVYNIAEDKEYKFMFELLEGISTEL